MKIKLIVIGKTDEEYLRKGISGYIERIKRYVPFEYGELPAIKNMASLTKKEIMKKEMDLLRQHLGKGEILVLLDEHGKEMGSVDFSGFLHRLMISGSKSVVFVAGGPFGLDPELRKQAMNMISLSRLTFSHQMVRLIFTEQLYRALTILRNESYHHE